MWLEGILLAEGITRIALRAFVVERSILGSEKSKMVGIQGVRAWEDRWSTMCRTDW